MFSQKSTTNKIRAMFNSWSQRPDIPANLSPDDMIVKWFHSEYLSSRPSYSDDNYYQQYVAVTNELNKTPVTKGVFNTLISVFLESSTQDNTEGHPSP